MCARYFTTEGATNSSSSVFAGVLSLWARQHRSLFPHFTGLSKRYYTSSQGRGVDQFYKWFHPKGAWWGATVESDRTPPSSSSNLPLCQLLTDSCSPPRTSWAVHRQARRKDSHQIFTQKRRNQHWDGDSPGSGAGKQGFRPLRAWHILVLVGFWALPAAVWSLQRPIQLIIVATANGGKQPSPDHPRTKDKHDTVGTSLERVPNSLRGQEKELTTAGPKVLPREKQTLCQTSYSTAQLTVSNFHLNEKNRFRKINLVPKNRLDGCCGWPFLQPGVGEEQAEPCWRTDTQHFWAEPAFPASSQHCPTLLLQLFSVATRCCWNSYCWASQTALARREQMLLQRAASCRIKVILRATKPYLPPRSSF